MGDHADADASVADGSIDFVDVGFKYSEKAKKYLELKDELLGVEDTLFSTDIKTYNNSSITYYLDETIMCITWKQLTEIMGKLAPQYHANASFCMSPTLFFGKVLGMVDKLWLLIII